MEPASLKGVHPVQNLGAVDDVTSAGTCGWWRLEVVEHDILDAGKPLEAKKDPIITPNQGARELVTDDEMSELVELADVLKEAVTEDPAKARQIVISANLRRGPETCPVDAAGL